MIKSSIIMFLVMLKKLKTIVLSIVQLRIEKCFIITFSPLNINFISKMVESVTFMLINDTF